MKQRKEPAKKKLKKNNSDLFRRATCCFDIMFLFQSVLFSCIKGNMQLRFHIVRVGKKKKRSMAQWPRHQKISDLIKKKMHHC